MCCKFVASGYWFLLLNNQVGRLWKFKLSEVDNWVKSGHDKE